MPRILVADDDPNQLRLRKCLLEAGGYAVSTALGAAETMQQVSVADLVIMDLCFPNASGKADAEEGLALIRRIRQSGFRAPVIVLSGWPEELFGKPEEAMVSRVFTKPVSMALLLESIGQLLVA
ncbi:MAG TPA: response regulator [Bryobacteraceae bacterium]|nr:response regulator [Bryobacteraceae bacterium]